MEDFIHLLELSLPRYAMECTNSYQNNNQIDFDDFQYFFVEFSMARSVISGTRVNPTYDKPHRKSNRNLKLWQQSESQSFGKWKMNCMNLLCNNLIFYINYKTKSKCKATIWHKNIFMRKFDQNRPINTDKTNKFYETIKFNENNKFP